MARGVERSGGAAGGGGASGEELNVEKIVVDLYGAMQDDDMPFIDVCEKYLRPYYAVYVSGDLNKIKELILASERVVDSGPSSGKSLIDAIIERAFIEGHLDINRDGPFRFLLEMNGVYLRELKKLGQISIDDSSKSKTLSSIANFEVVIIKSSDINNVDELVSHMKDRKPPEFSSDSPSKAELEKLKTKASGYLIALENNKRPFNQLIDGQKETIRALLQQVSGMNLEEVAEVTKELVESFEKPLRKAFRIVSNHIIQVESEHKAAESASAAAVAGGGAGGGGIPGSEVSAAAAAPAPASAASSVSSAAAAAAAAVGHPSVTHFGDGTDPLEAEAIRVFKTAAAERVRLEEIEAKKLVEVQAAQAAAVEARRLAEMVEEEAAAAARAASSTQPELSSTHQTVVDALTKKARLLREIAILTQDFYKNTVEYYRLSDLREVGASRLKDARNARELVGSSLASAAEDSRSELVTANIQATQAEQRALEAYEKVSRDINYTRGQVEEFENSVSQLKGELSVAEREVAAAEAVVVEQRKLQVCLQVIDLEKELKAFDSKIEAAKSAMKALGISSKVDVQHKSEEAAQSAMKATGIKKGDSFVPRFNELVGIVNWQALEKEGEKKYKAINSINKKLKAVAVLLESPLGEMGNVNDRKLLINTHIEDAERKVKTTRNFLATPEAKELEALADLLIEAHKKWEKAKKAAAASAVTLMGTFAGLGIYDGVKGMGPVTELGELMKAVGVEGMGSSFDTGLATLGVSTALALVIGLAVCQGIKASLAKGATKEVERKIADLKQTNQPPL